ncbi:MAG: hypothetical protein Kow0077_12380 [Anaerolineae bacterium]
MANFYPDQVITLPMTIVARERLLPPDVIGEVIVVEGALVGALDVVARGVRAGRYIVLDLRAVLGTDDPKEMARLIHVRSDQVVKKGDLLAGDPKRRRSQVRAPANGVVDDLVDGRLILQASYRDEVVRAGFRGTVVSLRKNRGVVVETTGGLVQGVWGNGRFHMGILKMAPRGGLNVLAVDDLAADWRGALVISPQPLDNLSLVKAETMSLGGVIAPSMPANLRAVAFKLKIPIMLTEGFGTEPMNRMALEVLESYVGRQASLDARAPNRWLPDRAEVIIPANPDTMPERPTPNVPLRVGASVRITRKPYAGVIAQVTRLPKAPQRLENGLRLPVAEVRLPSGRVVTVPLVNLELFGRG